MKRMKIGVIGCGAISGIYFTASKVLGILDIVACADIVRERAEAKAKEHGCRACTVEELLADPEIEIVANLTIPAVHGEIALKALAHGKHVYNEKPLAVTRDEAKRVLDLAKSKGLRVGCAPDTFMGGGIQTAIKLLNDGWIGTPVAATAFLANRWKEAIPEFLYKKGGGPMFDMGPYYLTALVAALGPVRRVAGSATVPMPERLAKLPDKTERMMMVETPTTIMGVMEFACGASGMIITSVDIYHHTLPMIEIYGTEGTLKLPDPNTFDGPVFVKRLGAKQASEIPLTHGYAMQSRGLGIADMAYAICSGRAHRACGEQAFHVLDIMHSFHESSETGKYSVLTSTTRKPAPLPLGLEHGHLDE
ncbi:MAG: Gfo/Idh/MocA family oxidoreductase [Kiritimatiellaeota bacterium]|nr:Gfo/Idh/MocA family oxidoreductase [Kiritimatiellota bacterium]